MTTPRAARATVAQKLREHDIRLRNDLHQAADNVRLVGQRIESSTTRLVKAETLKECMEAWHELQANRKESEKNANILAEAREAYANLTQHRNLGPPRDIRLFHLK